MEARPHIRTKLKLNFAPALIFDDEKDIDRGRTAPSPENLVDEFVRAALDPRMDPRAVATMYRLMDVSSSSSSSSALILTGFGLSRTWDHPAWTGLRAEEERRARLLEQLESLDEQVGEGTFQCPSCHGHKTFSQGLQTRSADEPLTYYVRCARAECPRSLKMWVVRG